MTLERTILRYVEDITKTTRAFEIQGRLRGGNFLNAIHYNDDLWMTTKVTTRTVTDLVIKEIGEICQHVSLNGSR
jgi:hypothetical protein